MTDIFTTLKNMKKVSVKSINLERAKGFREFTIEKLKANQLGLLPILPHTISRRKANLGGVLYDTGELGHGMKTKSIGVDSEAGYFENDTEKHADTNLTNYQIADIHTNNVRKPRPLVLNSAIRFEGEHDEAIIEREFDKFWANV